MILFYLDGVEVSRTKARTVFMSYLDRSSNTYERETAMAAWNKKAVSEEAREIVNNVTQSLLEVVFEE